MKTNNWHIEQTITRCKNGDWYIVNGANEDLYGVLDLHCIVFISHRLAIRKEFPTSKSPAQIAYFPPWDTSYYNIAN